MLPLATQFEAFQAAFDPVLDGVVRFVEKTALREWRGWSQQLASYRWGQETSWEAGVNARYDNAEAVAAFLNGTMSFEAVTEKIVRKWGGISQKLSNRWEQSVRETMVQLSAEPDRLVEKGLCGGRIASVTKLYSAMDLERWVIYDSRVAAALTYLVAATGFQDTHGKFFGTLAGKNPKHLRVLNGFPRLWPHAHAFAIQSFVYTSWACRSIAERLNASHVSLPDGSLEGWKAYHVEMVLFMLGYDLSLLPPLTKVVPALQGGSVHSPLSMDCIVEGELYLGAFPHPHHIPQLKQAGIEAVLSMVDAQDPDPVSQEVREAFAWAQVPMRDSYLGGVPRVEDLADAIAVLRSWRRQGVRRIYLHCLLGQGRSPLVAMAYLVHGRDGGQKMRLTRAIAHVANQRPEADPNVQQLRVLTEYIEKALHDPRFAPERYRPTTRVLR